MTLSEWEHEFERRQTGILEDWMAWVRFPSVSADPAHHQDCVDCADWIAGRLNRRGFEVERAETGTKPFVFAERPGRAGRPVLLLYGHYDVQPADPAGAWTSPPFAPEWRGDRLYGRGAQDNKGQLSYTLVAIETLLETQPPDIGLKILIEGEEECGSAGLQTVLPEWRDRLKADVLLVHDMLSVPSGAPTLVMGMRGLAHLSVEINGADHDLHSGIHGGLAPNAAQGAARLTASLFDSQGGVAVQGFYDGVVPPRAREFELACATPFDAETYRKQTGVSPVGGMIAKDPRERIGFLPSLDVNGLHSGYAGSGMKTIIPGQAQIKLTVRLVPDQDPHTILDAVTAHLFRQVPEGFRLTVTDRGIGGPGFRLDPDSDPVRKARRILNTICPGEPVAYLWEGASVPIVSALAEASGAIPLLAGFGHETDRIHAPDESFSLSQFRKGFLYTALLLQDW